MSDFDCDVHQEDKDEIWQCLSCYDDGVKQEERERIIKLWDLEMACDCEEAMQHLKERIKGEQE